ncbi:MAG: GAF domain-containing protein [Bdellovibrionaceae bacterium]|jgi:hypothetical protein|nr:GAF domain-containing protein [Pseudobdellovibrionaceae bacterium]
MPIAENKIEILSNVLKIIAICTEQNKALEKFMDEVVKMPFLPIHPKAGIFLKVPGKEQLELTVYTENFSPELLKLCAQIDYGKCLCGIAAQTRKLVFAECIDDRHHVRFDTMTPHGHYNVPFVMSDGELAGVLVLYVDHGHKSSEQEVHFLEYISYGLGIICEKFLLHDRAVEFAMYDVAQTMITSLNHEINNPLAIALGLTRRLLKEDANNEKVQKLEKSLNRITEIVKKIDKIIEKKDIQTEGYTQSTKKLKI